MANKFIWNGCGVCINHNRHPILDRKEKFSCEVRTATDDNGKWVFGYDWDNRIDGYEGAGSPITKHHKTDRRFDTEQECVDYCIEHVFIPVLESRKAHAVPKVEYDDEGNEIKTDFNAKIRAYDNCIAKLRAMLADNQQLTLF